ncbi:MAG TPA: hypothetical protein DEH78_00235, partial [Solibacterales bacterium]|nr:hypothetical protein [Bryobacterales bacterium]
MFLVCLLALVPACTGQTSATIAGLIEDESGGALKGATVTVRRTETGLLRLTETDAGGRFVVPSLNPGRYQVRVERAGFRPFLQSDLDISVGETLALSITLRVGPVEEAITVVGRPPQINTTSSDLSYLVEGAELRDLPLNGRNYTDLAFLQPGVIAYPHRDGGSVVAAGVGMTVNGLDPRSNVYLLDGTPQNNFTNGPAGSAAGTSLGMETIREFRVEVNNYSAEFGRNAGGQINVLTKSGSNDFHGSVYHYLRNDNFDARNFFDQRIPEFKRNQFGGAAGGPIRKDKTFFFAGYESLRERLGRTVNTIVPDLQARQGILPGVAPIAVDPIIRPYLDEFPQPNGPSLGGGTAAYLFGFNQAIDQTFVQGRLDHRFNASNDVFARYTLDDADQRLPMDFPQFPRNFISQNQFATVEWKRILGASTFATFRAGFSRTRTGQNVEANTSRPLTPFVPGRPYLGNIDITGIPRFGPQSSANLRLTQNIFNFEPQATHIRGRHTLKFGGLIERYRNNMVNPTFSLGIYNFASLADFLRNRPLRFVGLTPQGAFDRYWRNTLFGAFLQDDFRLHPRLTLNLGL